MKLSVVIPSYNSGSGLLACLLSLNWQNTGQDFDYEVVVVDDGSDDGTQSLIEQHEFDFPLNYLYVPRTAASGRSAARNIGIREATGTVVVMIDADEILPPGCLAAHHEYHGRRPDMVVAGPRGYLEEGDLDIEMLSRGFSWDALPPVAGTDTRDAVFASLSENLDDLATCWHFMFSCNVSVRREHLLAVGGFDESFTGWGLEDSELGFRLRQLGLTFAYNHEAKLYHQHEQIISDTMYTDWRANLVRFTEKHSASADVATQWVFDRAVDPQVGDISWREACHRFEFAVRALHGRLPGRAVPQVVIVDALNRDEVLAGIAERAATTDLLVIDQLADPELHATVQCLKEKRELAYFRRPSAEDQAAILAMFGVDVGAYV